MAMNIFLLPSDGMVSESIWGDYKFDNRALSQGNIFKTKEEAELEHDKRDLLTRFRQFRDQCNRDWKPNFKIFMANKYNIGVDFFQVVLKHVILVIFANFVCLVILKVKKIVTVLSSCLVMKLRDCIWRNRDERFTRNCTKSKRVTR